MKHTAEFLLPLLLSGTLVAESRTDGPQASPFPSALKHVVVVVQENRTPDNLFRDLSPTCTIPRGHRLSRMHSQSRHDELL